MKRSIIYALLALGLSVVSCSKSGLETPPAPERPNRTPVVISLSAGTMESPFGGRLAQHSKTVQSKAVPDEALTVQYGGSATKAAPPLTTDEEQQVSDVWAIQFDKASGNRVGQPYYASAEQISQSGPNVSLEAMLTSASTPQVVYFVANTHSPSLFHTGNCAKITDMEAVCSRIGNEFRPTAASGLPMLAAVEFPGVASGTPLAGITLRRLVAKVILRYKISSGFAGFSVSGVRLRNVPTAISYCEEPAAGSDFPAKDITYGAESHFDYPAEDITKAGTDGDYQTFTWYMPENLRRKVADASGDQDRTLDKTDGMAAYIEIKGGYRSPLKCEQLTYRILLGDAGNEVNDYNVRRNYIYTAEVTLAGRNMSDKRVTAESFDMNNSGIVMPNSGDAGAITFDIRKLTSGWQAAMPALGTDAALRAEVLWSDVASVIKPGDISLDKVNGLLTVRSTAATNGNAIVALYDHAASGGNILWSWHVWVTGYGPDGTKNYGLGLNSKADVLMSNGLKSGEVHRYGQKYADVNGVKVIMDRNLGATKAYYNAPVASDATADAAFGMFYQWGRKDPFPRWNGQDVVTPQTAKIYGADGTTVLAEGAENDEMATGYKKVNIFTSGVVNGTKTFVYAVKHPLTFITNYHTPFDWYTTQAETDRNDALWTNGGAKGVNDPCPKGWRVALAHTWDDFGTDPYADPFWYYINGEPQTAAGSPVFVASVRNGRLYKMSDVKAWYPAPGYRSNSSGTLTGVGNEQPLWSAGVEGTAGSFLMLHSNSVMFSKTGRSGGLQVRCVQE